MKNLKWSFLAGFLLTLIAFVVVSVVIMNWPDEPIPGWLSDQGGP